MNILFFIVHPAKYHLFKHTINHLRQKGHRIDIAIVTKDVLERLIQDEGWSYTNIFPEGRRNNQLPKWLALGVNTMKTIIRLHRFLNNKKYDLFVTDDLLVLFGRLKKIPTLIYSDDDLKAVPEGAFFYYLATKIIAPMNNDLGKFNTKKIAFNGYKELAYLHPNHFTPDKKVIDSFNPEAKTYFIIRLVSLTASHDNAQSGISDAFLQRIMALLQKHGRIYISSERELPAESDKHRLNIKPDDIADALYFSDMFISDSQTMTTEAAVLGVPSIRYNSFVGRISTLNELEHRYELTYGFRPGMESAMLGKIEELLNLKNRRTLWQERRRAMLKEKDDLTQWLIHLFENIDVHCSLN